MNPRFTVQYVRDKGLTYSELVRDRLLGKSGFSERKDYRNVCFGKFGISVDAPFRVTTGLPSGASHGFMDMSMRGVRQGLQVLWAIIILCSVNVVNALIFRQVPSEMSFKNQRCTLDIPALVSSWMSLRGSHHYIAAIYSSSSIPARVLRATTVAFFESVGLEAIAPPSVHPASDCRTASASAQWGWSSRFSSSFCGHMGISILPCVTVR